MSKPLKYKYEIAAALILAGAAALRLANLGEQGLFLDEAWSWAAAQLPLGRLWQLAANDPHPFLYYLLLKGWLIFLPASEAGLRLPSVLFSLGSVTLVMAAAARWWNWKAALLAGTLAALSSFDVYYAQEARMYALLGLLWLLSYLLLSEALHGRPRGFLAWGLVNMAMALTHYYGVAAGLAMLGCLGGYCAWLRWRKAALPASPAWLGAAAALTLAGALPAVVQLWRFYGHTAGGAWSPGLGDLLALFALVNGGLSAARAHFIQGESLVLPFLAALPLWAWALAAAALAVFALSALRRSLAGQGAPRSAAWLAGMTFLLPVALAAVMGAFDLKQWANKPFLAVAYISYLWIGAGLSLQKKAVQAAALTLAGLLALASLLPYLAAWEKTSLRPAALALPPAAQRGAFLLERDYLAPQAFYYLPVETPVWGMRMSADYVPRLVQATPYGLMPADFTLLGCKDAVVQRAESLWFWGDSAWAREKQREWPPCLLKKPIYVFEGGAWTPYTP
ncbi:MAG: glycosyltransferase family 39 protein [Chloroflexi bacterium]|nr:glycosyltransferase family 39 protein [Chloroflexota bacterium]